MHEVSLFEAILNTNIINFTIVILTLVLIFKKFNLGSLIDKMVQDVKDRVEKSSLDTKNALDEYKLTKKQSREVSKLEDEILFNARKNADILKEKIHDDTTQKQKELVFGFEKTNTALIDKYKKETLNEIYISCIDIAQDEVIKRLDSETHKKLINSSIDELDKIEGNLL